MDCNFKQEKKGITLTAREVDLLNYNNLDMLKWIPSYEEDWDAGAITDKQFDEYQKLFTKFGYDVSTRKEMNDHTRYE
tara:strand:+ start:305 stop:538 length:234 start_codon:yes stop_codon:yes gene_type:complete